jgi:hypothetical protein
MTNEADMQAALTAIRQAAYLLSGVEGPDAAEWMSRIGSLADAALKGELGEYELDSFEDAVAKVTADQRR